MKRQCFSIIIPAVLIGMSALFFSTQARAQARWGFGVGPSINSLYSDLKKTSFGAGGGGYLTRRFNSHLGLTLLGNYGQHPFTRTVTVGTQTSTIKFNTNALRGDLLFDYEISSGGFRPYVGLGLGGVTYKVTGKSSGVTFKSKKSYNTFDFGPSLGFRLMLGSRSAIDLGGSFRLTTSDSLDGATTNKAKDALITGMLGFTLFFGGGNRGTDIVAEQTTTEENTLDTFQERINEMEAKTPPEQPQQDMQEYVRLKSKMDELNQQINQKDSEINTLRTAVAEKEQSVNTLQTQMAAPVNSASFSRGYEEALSKFYGKRYTEALDQFNGIVAQFPDHPRVSNCVYWIGESHFGAGNYREAVNAFSRVLNYPKSLKRDDALLMLGRSYAQMNQKTEAREAFSRLIAEYPNSEFVTKAQEWLNRM